MFSNLFRPEWTYGRYHKSSLGKSAIMYNTIDGNGHLFDEDSSEFIEIILRHKKRSCPILMKFLIYSRKNLCIIL